MARSIIPKGGNDKIMTPSQLAIDIVNYFQPFQYSFMDTETGDLLLPKVMEPCKGSGAFLDALKENFYYSPNYGYEIDYCEIDEGKDFLEYELKGEQFTHVITNPPFSKFRAFLNKSMDISYNVIFLSLVNAFFFKARLKDIKDKGFGFKEIVFVDTPPKPWPQFGIQLGVVHLQKDYKGDTKFTYGLS